MVANPTRENAVRALHRNISNIPGHIIYAFFRSPAPNSAKVGNENVFLGVVYIPMLEDALMGNIRHTIVVRDEELGAVLEILSIQKIIKMLEDGDSKAYDILLNNITEDCLLHVGMEWVRLRKLLRAEVEGKDWAEKPHLNNHFRKQILQIVYNKQMREAVVNENTTERRSS